MRKKEEKDLESTELLEALRYSITDILKARDVGPRACRRAVRQHTKAITVIIDRLAVKIK